jgi:hypothetical protein
LKRFVAIWMQRQLSRVHQKRPQEPVKGSSSTKAGIDPTHTGTTAAGSVLGRAARSQGVTLMASMGAVKGKR